MLFLFILQQNKKPQIARSFSLCYYIITIYKLPTKTNLESNQRLFELLCPLQRKIQQKLQMFQLQSMYLFAIVFLKARQPFSFLDKHYVRISL